MQLMVVCLTAKSLALRNEIRRGTQRQIRPCIFLTRRRFVYSARVCTETLDGATQISHFLEKCKGKKGRTLTVIWRRTWNAEWLRFKWRKRGTRLIFILTYLSFRKESDERKPMSLCTLLVLQTGAICYAVASCNCSSRKVVPVLLFCFNTYLYRNRTVAPSFCA